MTTTKAQAIDNVYGTLVQQVEAEIAKWKPGDTFEISVMGIEPELVQRLRDTYEKAGWTIEYQECVAEYEDLVFS